ncbi:MAG: Fe-S-containing protein [Succinivibrio sp.]
MLKYLVSTVGGLGPCIVALALAWAVCAAAGRDALRPFRKSLAAAVVIAAAIAWVRFNTRLIKSQEILAMAFTAASYACAAVLFLSAGPALSRGGAAARILGLSAGVYCAALICLELPTVLMQPARFVQPGQSMFSGDFFSSLAGWLIGLLLLLLCALAIVRSSSRAKARIPLWTLAAAALILAISQAGEVLQFLLARRIIPMNQALFGALKFTVNYSGLFVILTLLLGFVPAAAAARRGMERHEGAFANKALRRRFIADRRGDRRQGVWLALLTLLCLLDVTAVQSYENRGFTLTPGVDVASKDGMVAVKLSDVEDGHLHRFIYTAKDGTKVRFIIIRKNETAYGVGLDACEICGPTGYYERDGQVVCMRCDVVMNKSTIGYKGGCNPIPVGYRMENAAIEITDEDLEAAARVFR